MCGINNATVFEKVTDEDINIVEQYVRTQLPDILVSIALQNGVEPNIIEKSFFFSKKYGSDPSKFSFVHGEKMLIREIAAHVNSKMNVKRNDGTNYFALKPEDKLIKFPSKTIVNTSVGLIYGDHASLKKSMSKPVDQSPTDLKSKLMKSAQALTKNYRKGSLSNAPGLTDDMIHIDFKDMKNVKATVECIFCGHKCRVSLKKSQSAGSWTLSNLKTHYKSCITKKHVKPVNRCQIVDDIGMDDRDADLSDELTDDVCETTIELDIQADLRAYNIEMDDKQLEYYANLNDKLQTQMTVQNVKMNNAVYANAEMQVEIEIATDSSSFESINVCLADSDGNCMLTACCHQLYGTIMGSIQQNTLSINMRNDTVKHIRENLTLYEHDIKGRIYEKFPGRVIDDIQKDCEWYLDRFLSRDRWWGGAESLKAISIIHQTNVIVFNEKGEVNFGAPFDPDFKRSIMIAFRCSNSSGEDRSNKNRNHYDSVVNISEKVISMCSNSLLKSYWVSKLTKNYDAVIELSD